MTEPQTQTDGSAPSDHGTCVAAVAQGEDVGGDNENHGGAVSEAARVTCAQDTTTETPKTEDPTDDQGDSQVESTDTGDSESGTETETDDSATSDGGSHSTSHSDGRGNSHGDGSND